MNFFLGYSSQYTQDEELRESSLSDLSFVESSDFAVLDSQGQVEAVGSGGKQLQKAFRDLRVEEEEDDQQDVGEDRADLGGQTTLMLFNIFTPDEVDLLAQLVRKLV